ncbi:hypothetical protein [Aliarcobacter butzleri]|uniref:hypothetical protein n=1 Tax=Aliarcobacter butzleri TaxID=28197 RepID=UPI001269A99B|nr:hypothetical protein [Aliarcobacter butzleri]
MPDDAIKDDLTEDNTLDIIGLDNPNVDIEEENNQPVLMINKDRENEEDEDREEKTSDNGYKNEEDEDEDEDELNSAINNVKVLNNEDRDEEENGNNFNHFPTTNKKLKIIVGNGRPGLGKSTVAMQLIAPYLFTKNGQTKVPLYTFESLTDNNMFSTNILNAISVEVKENSFDNSIINLLTKDEYAIYDIGGGKTTQVVTDCLVNTGLIYGIDLFVIPLTDGKHEAIKAREFYHTIKYHNPDANFVFVLNKVANNAYYDDVCMQYIDFLGDRNLMIDATRGIIEDINPEDRNLAHLHNDDIVKYSVRNEKTVYELAFTNTSKTDDLLIQALKDGNTVKQKLLSARKNSISKAKKFFETSIKPSMDKFDQILGYQNA